MSIPQRFRFSQHASQHIVATIRHESTVYPLKEYVLRKMGITRHQAKQIDWPAYAVAYNTTPILHQFAITKLTHEWLHTGTRQVKISPKNKPTCPNCTSPETFYHIFQCDSTVIRDKKTAAINQFYSKLVQISANQQVIFALRHMLTPWLHGHQSFTIQSIDTQHQRNILDVIQHQLSLGIQHMITGRISKKWRYLQFHIPMTLTHSPTKNQIQWTSTFIQALWNLSLSLWTIRNESLHSSTPQSQSQTTRWVKDRLMQHYTEHNSHPRPELQHLFNTPLSNVINSNKMAMTKLAQTLDIATERLQTDTTTLPTVYEYIHESTTPQLNNFEEIFESHNDTPDTSFPNRRTRSDSTAVQSQHIQKLNLYFQLTQRTLTSYTPKDEIMPQYLTGTYQSASHTHDMDT